jgi:hypothetical protein
MVDRRDPKVVNGAGATRILPRLATVADAARPVR